MQVQQIFDRMAREIKATQNRQHRTDLLKLYRSCENIHFDITNEMVECRRRKIETAKLRELHKQFEEAVNTFDQWLVYSRLLS